MIENDKIKGFIFKKIKKIKFIIGFESKKIADFREKQRARKRKQ